MILFRGFLDAQFVLGESAVAWKFLILKKYKVSVVAFLVAEKTTKDLAFSIAKEDRLTTDELPRNQGSS
jgi:hypothetical protein